MKFIGRILTVEFKSNYLVLKLTVVAVYSIKKIKGKN